MLVDVMHCVQLTDALVVKGIHRQHRAGYRGKGDVEIDRQFVRGFSGLRKILYIDNFSNTHLDRLKRAVVDSIHFFIVSLKVREPRTWHAG